MQLAVIDNQDDEGAEWTNVGRIRLVSDANATAVLGDFRSVEKLLAAWTCDGRCSHVRFVVTFASGNTVSGVYILRGKSRRSPSFEAQVVMLLQSMVGARAACSAVERELTC